MAFAGSYSNKMTHLKVVQVTTYKAIAVTTSKDKLCHVRPYGHSDITCQFITQEPVILQWLLVKRWVSFGVALFWPEVFVAPCVLMITDLCAKLL